MAAVVVNSRGAEDATQPSGCAQKYFALPSVLCLAGERTLERVSHGWVSAFSPLLIGLFYHVSAGRPLAEARLRADLFDVSIGR